MTTKIDRREFIRRSAAGSAALGLTIGAADQVNAETESPVQNSPNGRVTIGFIGTGARAHTLIEAFKQDGNINHFLNGAHVSIHHRVHRILVDGTFAESPKNLGNRKIGFDYE